MRPHRLDLGLALAAAARGYHVGRYSNPNETLEMRKGAMYLVRAKGKDALFSSLKSLDFCSNDWYVIGDDSTWLDRTVEQ